MHSYGSQFTHLTGSKMQYMREKTSKTVPLHSALETDAMAANEVDANILRINLGALEDVGKYATGDPFPCSVCGSFFNYHSKEHVIKEAEEKIWICEFCNAKNKLILDEAEYPNNEATTYVIGIQPEIHHAEEVKVKPVDIMKETLLKEKVENEALGGKLLEDKKKLENSIKDVDPSNPEGVAKIKQLENEIQEINTNLEKNKSRGLEIEAGLKYLAEPKIVEANSDDVTVIFCIDNSGSMAQGASVPTGKSMKYVRNKNNITRLEAVKVAVDQQLTQMSKVTPNRKIGFVTFESNVSLYGDCTQQPLTLDLKYLSDFYGMVEYVSNYSQNYLSKPIKESLPRLLQRLANITTEGYTALGPALVASAALAAKGSAGSKVILCTDGQANVGLGCVEGSELKQEETKNFYNQVGQYAQQHGIVISVISLVEGECRLDLLSPIAGLTGGDVLRVNPANLSVDFSALLSEKVIATQVCVKVRLHKIMMFSAVPEQYLSADKNVYIQEIGSATRDSLVTCGYTMKPVADLEKMTDVDYKTIKYIPIQSQVEYRDLDGKKCIKVVTQMLNCTEELDQAKTGIDKNVIMSYGSHTTSKYAKHGMYEKARTESYRISSIPEDKKTKEEVQAHVTPILSAIGSTEEYQAAHGGKQQLDVLSSAVNQALKKA